MAIVYRHRRLDTNEIFYIGIGKTEKRAYFKFNRNKYWNNIINKTEYGVEILYPDISWEDACELEQFLIQEYGRRDLGLGPLVNMTDGGEGTLGNKTFLGKKLSDEHKMNISKGNKGKLKTKEHKEKLSKARKGLKLSDEIKKQLKEKRKNLPASRSKLVINLETGIFYDNAKIASKTTNIKYITFVYYLNHIDKNKTSFIYI